MRHVFEFEAWNGRNNVRRKANVWSDDGNLLGGLTEQLETSATAVGTERVELRPNHRLGLGWRHGQEAGTAADLVLSMVAAGIARNTNDRRDNLGGLIYHVVKKTGDIEFDDGLIETGTGKGP